MAGLLDHTLHMPRPLARSDTANYYVAQRDIGRRDLGSSLPPQRAQQRDALVKSAIGGRVASSCKKVEKIAPHPRSIANRNHLSCMAFPYADCDNRTDMRIGRLGPGSVWMHTCKTACNASRHEHHTASQTGAPNREHEHGSSRHMTLLRTSARALVHDQRV